MAPVAYAIDRNRVTWDEIDGETLIIDAESGYYFSLDGVGSLIWDMLADGFDEATMVARIVGEYEVDEAMARGDLQALVAVLAGEGLIESARVSVDQEGR